MAEEFANKIKRLELENFTCFGKAAMDFSPGINVFIGENGTGKTHLLKVMYGVLKWTLHSHLPNHFHSFLNNSIDFSGYFGLDTSSLLRRKTNGPDDSKIKIFHQKIEFEALIEPEHFRLKWSPIPNDIKRNTGLNEWFDILYCPVDEMLSWGRGFINIFNKIELDVDRTYYDMAIALDGNLLVGEKKSEAQRLVKQIENELQIKVYKRDKKFFISLLKEKEEFEASLVATGINKLAQLIYLIMNGSLTKDTILFWDEPEANLNPKYILVVSKFLQTLAKAGCQIFVATHDYLLPYDLSLSKEYQEVEGDVPDMKFFSLYKGENGTEVEEGATMPELNHDPIHEGLSKHNEREDILFRKSLNPQA